MSSDTLDSQPIPEVKAKRKRKDEKIYYTGNPHHAYGGVLIPLDSETVQFASHLTGHSEITIKAMYQEWIGNKNKPFKPL
jgi:hypothetical protein